MSLRHGHDLLAMPGPTNVPEAVLSAMHHPAVDIYAGPLLDTTARCLENLASMFQTAGNVYLYAANGHGAWEASLCNTLSRGDEILVLESGRFAPGWGQMGEALGLRVTTLEAPPRGAVDPDAVEARLREDRAGTIKAVLVVQVDTATGVVNDLPAIRAALDAAGHDALLFVDAVASLACMPLAMDEWGVDVAVAASQKGLMAPPGLSFCAAGPRARRAHETANLRTRYWDWTEREGPEHYQKYCGTPPEHMLFALDRALQLLVEEGIEAVFRRHRLLARAVREAVATWSQAGALEFNIRDADQRADSVTVIRMRDDRDPAPLVEFCRETCGLTLGIGIGELRGRAFRLAHMGHIHAPMILGMLATVELGLRTTGCPHGRGGVEAAIEVLGDALSAGESGGALVSP